MTRIVRPAITILASSVFFLGATCFLMNGASAQKQRRRPPARSRPIIHAATIDYSRFSHTTKKHQGACNSCHKIPTDNWKKVRDFPDVADFPGHDACVSCHRSQFFKAARPAICSVCHSKVSPRDDVRFAFRNPAVPRQFLIEFPHDKHQDVIAQLIRFVPAKQEPLFVRAAFTSSVSAADDKAKHFNNCEICHGTRATAPLDAETPFIEVSSCTRATRAGMQQLSHQHH